MDTLIVLKTQRLQLYICNTRLINTCSIMLRKYLLLVASYIILFALFYTSISIMDTVHNREHEQKYTTINYHRKQSQFAIYIHSYLHIVDFKLRYTVTFQMIINGPIHFMQNKPNNIIM